MPPIDREPSDTLETVVDDDDATYTTLPAITPQYDHAPVTVEQRLSPFHPPAAEAEVPEIEAGVTRAEVRIPTFQGMPALQSGFVAPVITQSAPAVDPSAPNPVLTPPPMIAEPEPPAVDPAWDQPTDPDAGGFVADYHRQQPAPEVPAPGAPNIQISKSMEIQVSAFAENPREEDPSVAPVVKAASPRRRAAQQPTEVFLPALKRKKQKEGSDWGLIFGLLALVLVIMALIALVALGVMGHLGF